MSTQLCGHSYNHWVTLSKSLLSIHIIVGTAPYFLRPKKHQFKVHHFLYNYQEIESAIKLYIVFSLYLKLFYVF